MSHEILFAITCHVLNISKSQTKTAQFFSMTPRVGDDAADDRRLIPNVFSLAKKPALRLSKVTAEPEGNEEKNTWDSCLGYK